MGSSTRQSSQPGTRGPCRPGGHSEGPAQQEQRAVPEGSGPPPPFPSRCGRRGGRLPPSGPPRTQGQGGPGHAAMATGATHCAGSRPGPRRCSTAKDQPHACQRRAHLQPCPGLPTAFRLGTRCCPSSLGRCPHNPCLMRSTGVLPTPQAPAVATGWGALSPRTQDTGSLPGPGDKGSKNREGGAPVRQPGLQGLTSMTR